MNRIENIERFQMVGSALDYDVIELKKMLGISYEMACHWLQHRLDKWSLKDCRDALSAKMASLRGGKEAALLDAICERYSLAA